MGEPRRRRLEMMPRWMSRASSMPEITSTVQPVRMCTQSMKAWALRASRSGRNLINHGPELEADLPYCARESILEVVPRFVGMHGVAAEIRLPTP